MKAARPNTALVTRACRQIESAETEPSLAELAAAAGMSAFHFHRIFKHLTGLTPKQYAAAHRVARVRTQVRLAGSVTEAIYAAGYSASGRFYEDANQALGMTPTTFRGGGQNSVIHFAVGECSLGSILVAQSARGVCAILLGDDPDQLVQDLEHMFPKADLRGAEPAYEQLVAKVVGYIEAGTENLDLPLDIRGTAFQRRVWQALRAIPVGSTVSYSDIAETIGAPGAVRAVAKACASNTLAIAIPCHRVVRKDGGLAGYRWGVERKLALLQRETGK